MDHEERLASLRRWFTLNKSWIRLTALAAKLKVPHSTLTRALTENVEQQRNVTPEFLDQITKLFANGSFQPGIDYTKTNG